MDSNDFDQKSSAILVVPFMNPGWRVAGRESTGTNPHAGGSMPIGA
jgi:hypothetical protein